MTIGISFLAAAYFQALFGPELPFTSVFPGYEAVATIILLVVGALILVGAFTRLAALAALALFGIAAFRYGAYMLTYANYFARYSSCCSSARTDSASTDSRRQLAARGMRSTLLRRSSAL